MKSYSVEVVGTDKSIVIVKRLKFDFIRQESYYVSDSKLFKVCKSSSLAEAYAKRMNAQLELEYP